MTADFGQPGNHRRWVPAGTFGTVEAVDVDQPRLEMTFDNRVWICSSDGDNIVPAPEAPPAPVRHGPPVYRLPDGEQIEWDQQQNGDYIASILLGDDGKLTELAIWQVALDGPVFREATEADYWPLNLARHRRIQLGDRNQMGVGYQLAKLDAWLREGSSPSMWVAETVSTMFGGKLLLDELRTLCSSYAATPEQAVPVAELQKLRERYAASSFLADDAGGTIRPTTKEAGP